MKILINKETGIPMFPLDQLLMDPAIKSCYDKFGVHGLHYAVLFGWEGSPYKTKTDVEQRHQLVYDSVRHLELYDTMKNKLISPTYNKMIPNMYVNPFVIKAIEVINTLARIPVLEMRNYYLIQLDLLKKQASEIKFGKKEKEDPVQLKKTADTQALFMTQIQKIQKAIDEIDERIEKMFHQEKHVDLYDLIKSAE